jgi:hypothetical protein
MIPVEYVAATIILVKDVMELFFQANYMTLVVFVEGAIELVKVVMECCFQPNGMTHAEYVMEIM